MGSGARGPSQRQLRVGEVIRQRLAEALARDDLEAKLLKKTSITVTEVRITPELRRANGTQSTRPRNFRLGQSG